MSSTSTIGNLLTEISVLKNTDRGASPTVAALSGIQMSPEQDKALHAPIRQNAAICAGAGAGKTRLLVERAALLCAKGVSPSRIGVLTFTRKSAQEIRHRIQTRLGAKKANKDDLPQCTTVHALALGILRRQRAEKNESVKLLNDEEMGELLDELREGLESSPLLKLSSDDDDDADELDNEELLMLINKAREDMNYTSREGLIAARFEALLEKHGATDFTALLKDAVKEMKGGLFDFVLVDEAQDLSLLQRMFIKAIGTKDSFYWYIGDGDQSIYSFRGAHAGVMNQLARHSEETYILSVNYRCAKSVVEHANRLINLNQGRIDIQWKPHRTDEGSVGIREFDSCEAEFEAMREWLMAAPAPGSRMVLARTQALVERLKAEELPACSVHESKGLEWEEVWVAGCESGLFPHPLCTKSEERRLFYVAMTRAKTNLIMTYALSRLKPRKGRLVSYRRRPSQFLFEAMDM